MTQTQAVRAEKWIRAAQRDELGGVVAARGYWAQVWAQLRRDRAAVAGAVFIVLLLCACFPGAWLAGGLLGHVRTISSTTP